jgi:diaminopimelate epimerase
VSAVWFKAHGLGNDYLVAHAADGPLTPDAVRAVCHRHTGCGGDGVLEPIAGPPGTHGVVIWNPDGSIAEKSGNGLRIFAWWLRRFRGAPAAFDVAVRAADGAFATVGCAVGAEVTVEMGAGRLLARRTYALDGAPREAWAVSVGNPHCVLFLDDPDAVPWRAWGAHLERHPDFPDRTNVQFARVDGPDALSLRIWERGAGETAASGSSACAVAWTAVHTGRVAPGPLRLRMPGGALTVLVRPDGTLRMTGPVAPVGFFLPTGG